MYDVVSLAELISSLNSAVHGNHRNESLAYINELRAALLEYAAQEEKRVPPEVDDAIRRLESSVSLGIHQAKRDMRHLMIVLTEGDLRVSLL